MNRDFGSSASALIPTLVIKDQMSPILCLPRSLAITVVLGFIVMCLFIGVGQVHQHPKLADLALADDSSSVTIDGQGRSSSSKGVSLAFPAANATDSPLFSSCPLGRSDHQVQLDRVASHVREALWSSSADRAALLLQKTTDVLDTLVPGVCAAAPGCACSNLRFLQGLVLSALGKQATAHAELGKTSIDKCPQCHLLLSYLYFKDDEIARARPQLTAVRSHASLNSVGYSGLLYLLTEDHMPHVPALYDALDWLFLVQFFGSGIAPSVDDLNQLSSGNFVVVSEVVPTQLRQRLVRLLAKNQPPLHGIVPIVQHCLFSYLLELVHLVSQKPMSTNFQLIKFNLLGFAIIGDTRFDPATPICFESGCTVAAAGDFVIMQRTLLDSAKINPRAISVPFSWKL